MKNNSITLFSLVCLLSAINFALFSSSLLARTYDDIIESGEITIAVYRDYAPFSYLDNGKAKGIDVDIAHHIAQALEVKLNLRWMTAGEKTDDDLRVNLWKKSRLHSTLSDLMLRVPYDQAYSQQRNDIGELAHSQVHMFAPYHTEKWQIIFNKEKIDDVPTMAIFQYHNIGVEVDSIPQFYLTSAFRGSMRDKAKQYNSITLAVKAMAQGEVDAAMGLRSQISHLQQQVGEKKYSLATNAFPMLGKQQWDIGMAVKNDYRQLAYAVTDIIEAMIKKGTVKAIFAKYHVIYQLPDYYQNS